MHSRKLKVALVNMKSTANKIENLQKVEKFIIEAYERSAQWLILPRQNPCCFAPVAAVVKSICQRTPMLSCCRMMLCVLHAAECSIRRVAAAYADANMCFLTGGTLISALLFAPLCLTP